MIFALTFLLWLLIAVIITKCAQAFPLLVFIVLHTMLFIACLKIIESFL